MHLDLEDLTMFQTCYSTYKCKVLPFGLINRPTTQQRFMNNTLFDYLDDFCTVYLDNIIIYLESKLKHKEHICKVLIQLYKVRLQADIQKSEFYVQRTKYLGFIISIDSIEANLENTAIIE